MIYFIVARHDDIVFKEWLGPSLKKFENSTIIEVFNEPNDSIFKKYNRGLSRIDLKEGDLVCFVHEDVRILDHNFEKKISLVFEKCPDIGVLGVIGTKQYEGHGWWHCNKEYHFGHIEQGLPDGTHYHMVKKIGFDDKMVVVDGCVFILSSEFLKKYRFDEETFQNDFHFYDVDTCLTALSLGFRVSVADITVFHKSEGPLGNEWRMCGEKCNSKWVQRGYKFPWKI